MKKLILAVLAALLCLAYARAVTEEEVRAVGGNTLDSTLTGEQRAYLDGIRPETADDLAASFSRLLDNVSKDGQAALRSGVQGLLRVAAVIALTAAARGFSSAAGGEADGMIDMAGALGCTGVLLRDFTGVLALCRDTMEQISLFSGTLQPVLATVLSVGGSAATATALQLSAMVVFDLVIRLLQTILVPAVCAYLAIASVDAAAGSGMLCGIGDGIKGLTPGVLKAVLTLFTAYLTIAGGVSGSVDRMALKTAKFAVSGAMPVVGGVMSDAAETMLSGAALLKNSIGLFGLLCVTAICLVPFLRAGASYLCYRAGAAVLSPLCSANLRQLLGAIGTGFGLLLGMMSTCCMILYLELVYVVAMVKPI